MIRTYVIEAADRQQVLNYFGSLHDAKRFIESGFRKSDSLIKDSHVLAIRGDYFGEGFHKYILKFSGEKWKRFKI